MQEGRLLYCASLVVQKVVFFPPRSFSASPPYLTVVSEYTRAKKKKKRITIPSMNPARHRPFSAALPHPQQPNTAPHVGLFDDTNGRFVGLSTPPRGNKSDSGDAQNNGGVHSSVRRHHDTTQSPSQSRQRLSPSREFDPGVERTGAAAKRRFRSADAIAFQYYARYQRQRRPGRRSVENEVARSRSATPPPPMTMP